MSSIGIDRDGRQPAAGELRPASRVSGTRRRGGHGSTGAIALWVVVAGVIAAWYGLRPAGFASDHYLGEVAGVLAITLLSAALVLSMRSVAIERAFGGLDRMYVWHRMTATVGVALIVPHILLVGGGRNHATPDPASPAGSAQYGLGNNLGITAAVGLGVLVAIAFLPRIPVVRRLVRLGYEKWLASHRLTGLFVAAAVAHGLLVDPVIRAAAPLWWLYLAVGAVGVSVFAARQVGDLRGWGRADYVVTEVDRLNATTLEVRLRPRGDHIEFTPGQFVYASFGGQAYWQPHPFTISNAPGADELRLSIRATGDYTAGLYEHLRRGAGATVEGPYGGFDHQIGGSDQVWIAGGIGITPFLSWANSLDAGSAPEVDLFYAVASGDHALYVDELRAAVGRVPSMRVYMSHDDRDGFLSIERVATTLPRPLDRYVYFLCGPGGMIRAFEHELAARGVPASRMHHEEFGFR